MREWLIEMTERKTGIKNDLVITEDWKDDKGSIGKYTVMKKDGDMKAEFKSIPEYPLLILSDALDTLDSLGWI